MITPNEGQAVAKGAIAIIALGQASANHSHPGTARNYVAHSSEGGHSDFAPTDLQQVIFSNTCSSASITSGSNVSVPESASRTSTNFFATGRAYRKCPTSRA